MTGSAASLRLPLLTGLWLAASFLANPLAAQEPVFSDTRGPNSPHAHERMQALTALARPELLASCRALLAAKDSQAADLVLAIDVLGRERDKADISLIAPCIVHAEPEVAEAAMQALRGYGNSALKVIEGLGPDVIDAPTRRKVQEQLLKDHIHACCRRDQAVNPYQLDFDSRYDELFSVQVDLLPIMLGLLRESLPVVRQDLGGVYFNRRYYYGLAASSEPEFISYGALAVAALGRRWPEVLRREVWDLVDTQPNANSNYYGGQVREPVTREICYFFARNGRAEHLLKMVSDLDNSTRWTQDRGFTATVHCEIAACLMAGNGDLVQAAERLDSALELVDATGLPAASQARFLRARLRLARGDESAALRDIEESVEASAEPMLLISVDSAFKPLAGERRFQVVLSYLELVARRAPEHARPFKRQDR